MKIYINREHLLKEIDYPERYLPHNLLKTAGVVFVIAMLFLILLKPFGVSENEHKVSYVLICGLHALSPAFLIFIYFGALNYIRSKRALNSWNLLQEYVQVGIVILLTGIVGFLMRDIIYLNTNNWSWNYLWEEVRNSLVAGSIFYFLFRLTSFYFHSKKGEPFVLQFMPLNIALEKSSAPSPVFIKTQVKQDDFSLYLNDLLFARAEGNYIELTIQKDRGLKTELKRISLTQFESQISGNEQFFRCHRAYLVNMHRIENVTGNSQGYALAFEFTDVKVPVSRAQLDGFKNLYLQLRKQHSI